MEPVEIRTEDTAGKIAEEVTSIETPATDQADETQVVQTEPAEIATVAADESTETMDSNVQEAVVESTSEALEDPVMDPTETEAVMANTTEQPASANDEATCPLGECSSKRAIGLGVILVIVALVIIRLLKKKTGKQPAEKPTGKANGSDVVEIYVGNLSYDMTDNQLRKEFERFGVVKSARVITHRTNNKSKGYGFVEMPHRKEALIAIKALENAEVMGRRIRVNEARANTRPPER